MNAATLLLITTLAVPGNLLVLRTGHTIDIVSAQEQDGRVIFRTPAGGLYSLALDEVDLTATRAVAAPASETTTSTSAARKLKATESERKRLLEDLENNHSGQPAPPTRLQPLPPAPTLEEVAARTEDEWTWRNRAKALEEAVRQARENRDLLVSKAQALRSHIAGLISLGYKPNQFSYDTTQLQFTVEQIPYAELEITRAERALVDFREEARQRGIQPGWVR